MDTIIGNIYNHWDYHDCTLAYNDGVLGLGALFMGTSPHDGEFFWGNWCFLRIYAYWAKKPYPMGRIASAVCIMVYIRSLFNVDIDCGEHIATND